MSTSVLDRVAPERCPILKEPNNSKTLVSADGKPMKLKGRGMFEICLGSLKLERDLAVGDIADDILLGTDILQQGPNGPADLLLSEGRMVLDGISIAVEQIGLPRVVRKVCLTDPCIIPGMCEMILEVYVDGRSEGSVSDEHALDGELVIELYSLLLAPTLVDVHNNAMGKVRVLNPFEKPVSLKQGTVVGRAERIVGIETVLVNEDDWEQSSDGSVRELRFWEQGRPIRKVVAHDQDLERGRSGILPDHLTDLYEKTVRDCSPEESKAMAELLMEYSESFSENEFDLGRTSLVEHSIKTNDAVPVKHPPRRLPLAFVGEDKKTLEKLTQQGVVTPSTSPWASPLVCVRKKDGTVRPCVDYRRLNAVTQKDAFPIPRVDDCLDAIAGATTFSTLDISSAYHQIPVRQEDIPKTAFVTK